MLTNRIRVLRAEHRMSQADLADAIGVSRKTISTIEVGRFTPSVVIAHLLARTRHCIGIEQPALRSGPATPFLR